MEKLSEIQSELGNLAKNNNHELLERIKALEAANALLLEEKEQLVLPCNLTIFG